MRRTYMFVLPVLLAAAAASCADSVVAPPEGEREQLAVTFSQRLRVPGERLPWIEVVGEEGAVRVRVARGWMCVPLVSAVAIRGGDELAVVARVTPNPAALCALVDDPIGALDYEMTISAVASGVYRVRVFEGGAEEDPSYLGSETVVVR